MSLFPGSNRAQHLLIKLLQGSNGCAACPLSDLLHTKGLQTLSYIFQCSTQLGEAHLWKCISIINIGLEKPPDFSGSCCCTFKMTLQACVQSSIFKLFLLLPSWIYWTFMNNGCGTLLYSFRIFPCILSHRPFHGKQTILPSGVGKIIWSYKWLVNML